MSKFSSFLRKHASDLRSIGAGFNVLLTLAFDRQDKEKIVTAVAAVMNAADSIEKGLKAVEEATTVKVTDAQLKKAVAAAIPELLAEAAERAVIAYMAKQAETFPPITQGGAATEITKVG